MQLLGKLIPDIPLDMLVTIEDKDPSVLWLSSVAGMYKRMVEQLYQFPDRWEVRQMKTSDVVAKHRPWVDGSLPRRLRGPRSPVSSQSLPYMYTSFRRKCWHDNLDVDSHYHGCPQKRRKCPKRQTQLL